MKQRGGNTTAGTVVQQNGWTGADSQKWTIQFVSENIYVIKNKKSGLAIDFGVSSPANGQAVTLQTAANSADQKFRIIPSGENVEIPDGLYTISYKNNTSLKLNNSEGNIDLRSGSIFKVTNLDGYCHISEFYGNKALDLTNGGTAHLTNIQAATEDYNSNNQKWIIRNTGDGSVYITSYATNKVVGGVDNGTVFGTNIALHTPTGNDSQKFYFIEESRNGINTDEIKIGQHCYAVNGTETYGVDILNSLLYDVSEGAIQLSFEKQLYGYSTIRDVESGLFLESQDNNCVTFSPKSDSERQLWFVYEDSDELYLFNVYTETYLKYIENSDGSIQVTMCEDETDSNYKDIIFKNYQTIQEGTEYLIIPKNDLGKALLIDDTVQSTSYPIVLDEINYSNDKQKFIFEFSNEDNAYRIKNPEHNDLTLYVTRGTASMSQRESLFYIIQTTDGYYKLGYKNRMLSYIDGSLMTTYDKTENDDEQKFMLVPVSDVITDATYQILVGDDETKALSVNDSMNSDSAVTVETANSNDISQRFYVYNYNGSYKLISLYSGKTISLSEDFDSIVQAQISESDTLQKWQVINSVADDSDYSVKLVSYRTGDYLRYNNDALSTSYYSGANDQLFTLKRVTRNTISSTGEIVSVSDATKDISIDESVAVLSNISTNGRTTLRLSPDANGLWTIEDITSGTVLTETNNNLVFEENTSANSQKWLVKSLSDDSFILLNLHSGKALSNNNGTLSLNVYSGEQNQEFDIYNKGDVNHDGRISSKDLMLIKQYMTNEVQFSDVQSYCADYNDDGRINAKDVNALNQLLGGTSTATNEQTAESALTSNSTYSIMTRNSPTRGELTDAEIIEMTDEEFLTWLFGDVDFDSLFVTIFE